MNYFYLDNNKGITSWLTTEPLESVVLGEIKWKSCGNISICCNKKFYEENNASESINPSIYFKPHHLSILKSNLQKCARRKEFNIGMSTAISMSKIYDSSGVQIGLFELLRRITIIVIEDTLLFNEYSILVWFLCAMTKKFIVKNISILWIFDIISHIMNSDWQDKSYNKIENFDTKMYVNKILKSNISTVNKNLLLSILIRNSFGGMEGDVMMLNSSVVVWLDRFINRIEIPMIYKPVKFKNNE